MKSQPSKEESGPTKKVSIINRILPWFLLILCFYPLREFLKIISYPKIEIVGWSDLSYITFIGYIIYGIISVVGVSLFVCGLIIFLKNYKKERKLIDRTGLIITILLPIYLVVGQNYNTWVYNSIEDENNKTTNSEKKQLTEDLVDAYVRYKIDHGVYPKDYGGSMDDFIIPNYYKPDNFKHAFPLAIRPRPWYNLDPIYYGRTRICYYFNQQDRDYENIQCIKLPN